MGRAAAARVRARRARAAHVRSLAGGAPSDSPREEAPGGALRAMRAAPRHRSPLRSGAAMRPTERLRAGDAQPAQARRRAARLAYRLAYRRAPRWARRRTPRNAPRARVRPVHLGASARAGVLEPRRRVGREWTSSAPAAASSSAVPSAHASASDCDTSTRSNGSSTGWRARGGSSVQQSRARMAAHAVGRGARACTAEWRGEIDQRGRLLHELLRELEHSVVAAQLHERALCEVLHLRARRYASRQREEAAAVER